MISLANHIYLKKWSFTLRMQKRTFIQDDHHKVNKTITNLRNIDVRINDECYVMILIYSLSNSYEHFVDTMIYGKYTLSIKNVRVALN